MDFHTLVTELGRTLKLDTSSVTPDQQLVQINFEDNSEVILSHLADREEIGISAELCFASSPGEIAAVLMEAQAFGLQTDGCHFGYNREAGKFIQIRTRPLASLDPDHLLETLKSFLSVRSDWKSKVDNGELANQARSNQFTSDRGTVPMERPPMGDAFIPGMVSFA
ncbi:type III secretion system chaperone [Parachitinimonas caeni]|uniref:Type III secretion system chaperone n=1 Tax=Parachitinimonas caeni TaxID=3031301 RepID=A0ABT7DWE5_9NEIS|nr:type III secretion system chaperone [Parachitinimonas caeni]MDK2124383.1 type III secretion system chaperone [Parachitinimonas caeni]